MAGLLTQLKSLSDKFSGILGGGGAAIGLSIGSSSVKIVELKRTGKSWKLIHFGMVQLPDDTIMNREILNPVGVIESTKTLTQQIKLKSKDVCSSLSGTSVIIKRMKLEVPNMKELQDQVFWEAEQYIPYDISDVVMDYQLIHYSKDKQADVLLVAVKKSVLDSYMGAIEGASLKPKIMDVDFLALQNVCEENYPRSPTDAVAIVDVGAASIKTVVVYDGVPVFTKDSSMGGANLTMAIQKHLNLSFSDAETLKVTTPQNQMPQEVVDLMQITTDNFATEIKRAVDFYQASAVGGPVSAILVTGGSSKIPNLVESIQDKIGIGASLLNPFNTVSFDPAVFTPDYVSQISAVAAVPLGLALRAGAR